MKNVTFALLSGFGGMVLACGTTTTVDPATQTQAAVTTSDGDSPPPQSRHPGPPPAAFEACASKAVGDACSVTFGSETLSGKCIAPPAGAPDSRALCRPDKMPERGPHGPGEGHGPGGRPPGPPPEAFAACDGKAADGACSVTFGDRTIEGTCEAAPPGMNETRLACAPTRPPPAP